MKRTGEKRLNDLNIKWKDFYKNVFALVVPMALQNLINVGVTAADVVMLGKVSEKVLSGASLAGQIQYIMVLFLFGLTSGATVLTAQYWGKGDKTAIEKILALGIRSAVIVTAIFTIAAFTIPASLMRIFTNDPQVIAEGVKYLRIVACSYIIMGITNVYLYVMRSIERVIVATVIYLVSFLCNVVFNAIFIFGLFGFPALGIRGAAIATLIARIMELVLVCGYAKSQHQPRAGRRGRQPPQGCPAPPGRRQRLLREYQQTIPVQYLVPITVSHLVPSRSHRPSPCRASSRFSFFRRRLTRASTPLGDSPSTPPSSAEESP